MKKIPLISSAVLLVLLCVSVSYWVLQLMQPPVRKLVAPAAATPTANVESVATLFGGAIATATNYQLKGVVLANPMNQSVAIIAVDGKPPQAYPMKTELNPGVTLEQVFANYVLLSDNGVSKRIDLPQDASSAEQISPVPINSRLGYRAPAAPSAQAIDMQAAREMFAGENTVAARNARSRLSPPGNPPAAPPTSNLIPPSPLAPPPAPEPQK